MVLGFLPAALALYFIALIRGFRNPGDDDSEGHGERLTNAILSRRIPRCDFPRVDGSGLTRAEFRHVFRGKPAIISDAFNRWNASALDSWSREHFASRFGTSLVSINNGRFDGSRVDSSATVAEVLAQDTSEFLIFSSDNIGYHVGSRTALDAFRELEPMLPAFLDNFNARRILSLGTFGKATGFHIHDETWLALLVGSKAWWVAPESFTSADLPQGEPCTLLGNGSSVFELPSDILFCVQLPGEIVYFGDDHPHATCNLEAFTLGIGAQGHTETWPPLAQVAHRGDVATVRRLLDDGSAADLNIPIGIKGGFLGQTPFHRALQSGHADLVESMLSKRAQATTAGSQGVSPMHIVVQFGYVSLLQLLLMHGLSTTVEDRQGRKPLHYAATSGHIAVARVLVNHRANLAARATSGYQPLHAAAKAGNAIMVYLLSELGANLSGTCVQGQQPIHIAALSGHLGVVKLLLDLGAPASAADNDGRQPLHGAVLGGHTALVDLLASRRASVTAASKRGEQPLHLAVEAGAAIVQLLVSLGASISATNMHGQQPIHAAASSGHVAVVLFLASSGSDLSASNARGRQPMHIAAWRGHSAIVKVLADRLGSVVCEDASGDQPMHYAARGGHVEMVRLLTTRGAGVRVANWRGRTPADVAGARATVAMLSLLSAPLPPE